MAVRIGINGFGRIGRYLVRLLASDEELIIAAINARADNASLAHLFKYDSSHGTFRGTVGHDEDGLIIDGRHIAVTRGKVGEWPWKELGVTLAVETSGVVKDRAGLAQHLQCGARKAIVSAPCKDADLTVVMGVNHELYESEKHVVLSAASCTTNCLAPAAKVLHESFGVRRGLMTTIHSYTMSQRILDGSHKDLRRARAACVSMIPTTTGAARATTQVIPALAGRLDGIAVRVPTPNVSLVDFTCDLEQAVDVAAVNAAIKAASEGPLRDNMGYSEEPLVSVDYQGSTFGGVVDAMSTMVIDNHLAKVILWYDNEAGFTNQLVRLLRMTAKDC